MALQPQKTVGDSLAMGFQPFPDEFGIQMLTKAIDVSQVSRHNVIDRMSRDELASAYRPKTSAAR